MSFNTGYKNIQDTHNMQYFDRDKYHRLETKSIIEVGGYSKGSGAATSLKTIAPYDIEGMGLYIWFNETDKRDGFIENKGVLRVSYTFEGFEYFATSHSVSAVGDNYLQADIRDLFIPNGIDINYEFYDNQDTTYVASDFSGLNTTLTRYNGLIFSRVFKARHCVRGRGEFIEIAENESYDGGSRYFCLFPWDNSHHFIKGVYSNSAYTQNAIFDIGFYTRADLSSTDNQEGFTRMKFGFTRFKTSNDYGVSTPYPGTEDTSTWSVPTGVRIDSVYMLESFENTNDIFSAQKRNIILHRDEANDNPNENISLPLFSAQVTMIAAKDNDINARKLRVFIKYEFIDPKFYDSLR